MSGQAVTTDVLEGASGGIDNIVVPAGFVAMAVQVDQVTGVGTIIKAGDYVDMVTGITGHRQGAARGLADDPPAGLAAAQRDAGPARRSPPKCCRTTRRPSRR